MPIISTPRYVAGGFLQDADKLLTDFQNLETLEFPEFANLWRQAYFSLIYLGREHEREMCEFTGECFMITLGLMQQATDKYRKVGALYLLYSMYYKQPLETKYKIRIMLPQWNEIVALFDIGVKEKCISLSYVVNRLVKECAFHFVVIPRMMGPRSTLTIEPWETPHRQLDSQNSYLISFLEEKPFSVMNDLHADYEKVKSYLTDTDQNELNVLDKCENDEFALALEAIAFNRRPDLKILQPVAEDAGETSGEAVVREGENIGNRRIKIKQKQFSTASSGHISKRRSQLLRESHSEVDDPSEGEDEYYVYNGVVKKRKRRRRKGQKRGRGRPPKGYVKKRGRPKKNAVSMEEEEDEDELRKPEPEEDENFVPEINAIDGVPVPSFNGRKVELKRRPPRGKKTKYHFASDSDEEPFVLSDDVVEDDEVEEFLRESEEQYNFVKHEASEEDEATEAEEVVNGAEEKEEEEHILGGDMEEVEILVNGAWVEDMDNEGLTF